jgi:hypothetical protein
MQNNLVPSIYRRGPHAVLRWTTIVVMTVAHQASGTTLTNVGYFTSQSHTVVTFEQRGDGSPTPTANAALLPPNEYAGLGFTFAPGLSPGVAWINDISASADAAQAIGGSLPLGIGATDNQGDFFIHFSPRPVRAFGFWVQHTNQRRRIPTFDAIGASGTLESAFFAGSAIDGTIGVIDYGFLGIAAAAPIESIHVRGDIALLDNLRFIAIPEPAGTNLCWFAGLALGHLALRKNRDARSCQRPRPLTPHKISRRL